MLKLDYLDVGGCPCGYERNGWACLCSPTERVIRTIMGTGSPIRPLTPEEREACLDEIAHTEGYDRQTYAHVTDQDLARGVLHAWAAYARDKGLL